MKKTINSLFLTAICFFVFNSFQINLLGKDFKLLSPDKKTEIIISITDKIEYSVKKNNKMLIIPSSISMIIDDKPIYGAKLKVKNIREKSVNQLIQPVVKQKSKDILEFYNEVIINFTGDNSVTFRAYNEGIAYRFSTGIKKDIKVNSEQVNINFAGDYSIYFPEEESFQSHNERLYKYEQIKRIDSKRFCSTPALVDTKEGIKIAITESDLDDYAGLWLQGTGKSSLNGLFPGVALEEKVANDRDVIVTKHADYIAKTRGTRTFPWRILAIAENDGDLITNQMVYLLSKPTQIKDVSWIKAGKVAWDWWNFNNIYSVDFKAGVNTETYKYYIDFASKYGIEYIILDEGWYKLGNLMEIVPEINMQEIVDYGKQKNVGIILWVVWKTLDDQLQPAMNQFEKWGIKGIKVDFMQRDDQWMVDYYWKIAQEASKRKMLVDFHGAYKPCGLNRAYPNMITSEGVKGLENCKWSAEITPKHDVTLPFIRMLAGPMDFTPGAMVNAQKISFRPVFESPMSMGTRCHQLAMYVVFESPLQMLADNPSNYYKEPVCMEFLSKVPSVWDETKVIDAKVGEYIVLARKSGVDWYIGAMTDETAREFTIDLLFLEQGNFTIDSYQDGNNADRFGSDFKKQTRQISKTDKLQIKLATGGGFAARIHK